jgi:hypothetical protein
VYFSRISTARDELESLLKEAQIAADDVAYTVSRSIGCAPVFWQLLDWFYTQRP